MRRDGAVVAWGWNNWGQCNVPEPNAGFVAIGAGQGHNIGLRASHGDLNCDGAVNFEDINAFVTLLSN